MHHSRTSLSWMMQLRWQKTISVIIQQSSVHILHVFEHAGSRLCVIILCDGFRVELPRVILS